MKVYINGKGHMTKLAAMAINGKTLGMKHQGMDLYKVYINHDPVMTLAYFPARSKMVAHAFEWRKLL